MLWLVTMGAKVSQQIQMAGTRLDVALLYFSDVCYNTLKTSRLYYLFFSEENTEKVWNTFRAVVLLWNTLMYVNDVIFGLSRKFRDGIINSAVKRHKSGYR